jgi:predicted small lipoprotein YifL
MGQSVRVAFVAIALALSLTACGEKAPTKHPTVKKNTVPVTKKTEPREIVRSGFFTPSRNIRCEFASDQEGQALRCDIIHVRHTPVPTQACIDAWGHIFALESTGTVHLLCEINLLDTKGYRQLSYGSVWRRGPFACLADLAGLRCANSEGHGFELSRERSKQF